MAVLRYFNPVGAHPSGLIGENPIGEPENLMPYIIKVACKERAHLNVYGDDYDTVDGSGVRDYIHVVDLARAHVKALDKLQVKKGVSIYNIGTGKGYDFNRTVPGYVAFLGLMFFKNEMKIAASKTKCTYTSTPWMIVPGYPWPRFGVQIKRTLIHI